MITLRFDGRLKKGMYLCEKSTLRSYDIFNSNLNLFCGLIYSYTILKEE